MSFSSSDQGDAQNSDTDHGAVINQLVRSAAHSVGCAAAVVYRETQGMLEPLACFGASQPESYASGHTLWTKAQAQQRDVLVIDDASVAHALPLPSLQMPDGQLLRFMALAPVHGDRDDIVGALLVADRAPRAGLSAAEAYVLRAHTVQLAFQYGREHFREPADTKPPLMSEQLRLLESVVVNANDAVLITEAEPIDLPGPRIVYCNDAFSRITGFNRAEALGKTPRILQNENTDRGALDRLRQSLEHFRPIEVELLNARRDGSEFWVELSIVPVADTKGWFTHWVSVQRDVTERKQTEAEANEIRIARAQSLGGPEANPSERQHAEDKLAYAAFHDHLTKLHNRAYVVDRLHDVLSHDGCNDPAAQAAVLFLDLDRFKLVNDSLGHRSGDLLLMEVARRLGHCLRSGDTLARVGGDEFAVLIERKHDESDAILLAERIIERLKPAFRLAGEDIFTTCSIGIVDAVEDYDSPEDLLRDADVAMYAGKAKGAGNYAIFTGSMRADAIEALSLQNDLKRACERGEFALDYQPIHAPATGKLKGVEALVRWCHPKRGRVSPATFIPIAEEIGIIREIGHWVMQQACAQLQRWDRAFPGNDLCLNVNTSAAELRYHGFVAALEAILKTTGCPPHRLQMEVTENVFLHDPDAVGRTLEELRALGVRVAIDDFGTGYSALGYIDRYEVDTIKIDKTFIIRMQCHRRTTAIVKSILGLGRALDLDIVAEGVETQPQLDMLRRMHCPHVQGYLIARPMPPAAIEALLEQPLSSPNAG